MIENPPIVTEESLKEARSERFARLSAAVVLAEFSTEDLERLDGVKFEALKTAVQPLVMTPEADRPNYLNGTAISSEQFEKYFDNL